MCGARYVGAASVRERARRSEDVGAGDVCNVGFGNARVTLSARVVVPTCRGPNRVTIGKRPSAAVRSDSSLLSTTMAAIMTLDLKSAGSCDPGQRPVERPVTGDEAWRADLDGVAGVKPPASAYLDTTRIDVEAGCSRPAPCGWWSWTRMGRGRSGSGSGWWIEAGYRWDSRQPCLL